MISEFLKGFEPVPEKEIKSLVNLDEPISFHEVTSKLGEHHKERTGYDERCPQCQIVGLVGCDRHRNRAA